MEIQSFMASQYGVQDTSEVKRTSSMTLNEFQANFHPNSIENIDTTVLDEVNKKIRSVEELKVYQNEGLVESTVNERIVLKDNSINPDLIDEKGRTNLQRMEKGLAPIDENGKPYNLHHIGQNSDSPLAELKDEVHKKNDAILHDKSKPTEVHGSNSEVNWDKERSDHWKARAEEIKTEQNKGA